MTRILIAHQSTIPHYRVKFYNCLNDLCNNCSFDVVFDHSEFTHPKIFKEKLDPNEINFNLLDTKTFFIKFKNKVLYFQAFIFSLTKYDVIILEDCFNNLSYFITFFLGKLLRKKVAFWGHGRDIKYSNSKHIMRNLLEKFRLSIIRKSDAYFSYTNEVKDYLISKCIKAEKIFIINNTVDILINRQKYLEFYDQKDDFKFETGIETKFILLYVGRIDKRKRFEFLLNSFEKMTLKQDNISLIVIGAGDKETITKMSLSKKIKYLGPITDPDLLVKYYLMSDLYIFTGDVGLGPLTALSYNTIPVVINSPTHGPEFSYLNQINSFIIQDEKISASDFGKIIIDILSSKELASKKENAWASIQHLTIENMAKNFMGGIDYLRQ
jgi:glycosyltransferase involved in cell wall biosynthesis